MELRKFGYVFGTMALIIFGFILPWTLDNRFPFWPWYVFLFFSSLAFIYPLSLKTPFIIWMFFGNVMGWLNTRFILGVIFYFVFLPYGLVMKIFGRDPLSRKYDKSLVSYRNTNNMNKKYNMEDPF